jgi:hypothetical protein
MSVCHSVYVVYGIAIAPPREWGALEAALNAQAHHPGVRVQLFTVGDTDHVILGTGYEECEPNTYREVTSLPDLSAPWDAALREHVRNLGLTAQSAPCWLVVHDVS